ncbi:MAG: coproporphyrinogen dehydrogenase HemZ, partial [Monoglobaceae bacterium]
MEFNETPWGILNGIRPSKIATKLLLSGMSEADAVKYFAEEYGTDIKKAQLAVSVAAAELPVRQSLYPDGVSIYIGIPFCPSRCLYCSFVTCGTKQAAKLIGKYCEALKKEISYTADIIKSNNEKIETVYIGGGTPTTLSAEELDDILTHMYSSFDLQYCKEFTVEAGRPDTITADKLKVLKKHGVTRISINPQSMNQSTLDIIGRAHTPEQIKSAFYLARKCGFDNINMDVIAGLPGETYDMFKHTLSEVEQLSPEDTTVHVMSIKRSSRLHEYLEKYKLSSSSEVSAMV